MSVFYFFLVFYLFVFFDRACSMILLIASNSEPVSAGPHFCIVFWNVCKNITCFYILLCYVIFYTINFSCNCFQLIYSLFFCVFFYMINFMLHNIFPHMINSFLLKILNCDMNCKYKVFLYDYYFTQFYDSFTDSFIFRWFLNRAHFYSHFSSTRLFFPFSLKKTI